MRPTEREPRAVALLRDADAADWLDTNPRAALYFWDPDDGPCQRTRARLEVIAAAADVPLAAIDITRDRLVAEALGIKSVPTLVVFRDGEVVDRVMGAAPEDILAQALRA